MDNFIFCVTIMIGYLLHKMILFYFFVGEAEIVWSETCQSYKSGVILPENMNRGGSFD